MIEHDGCTGCVWEYSDLTTTPLDYQEHCMQCKGNYMDQYKLKTETNYDEYIKKSEVLDIIRIIPIDLIYDYIDEFKGLMIKNN